MPAMTATRTPERVLTVPEVAEHLRVEKHAVYTLIREGELRSIRVGRLIRVPESALTAFLLGDVL
ncbi:putative excisionase (fragment) [Nostocoides japonicum T1-X7]|uniref:Putative excisionase n=1 Tax=Nostocoides japonicum T1-X7 TaxID=1194083 RepID=A0A077LYU4_9MICO